MGQLEQVPESIQESKFIKGLKEDVREAVRIVEPESLTQAICMAIKINENQTKGLSRSRVGFGTPKQGTNFISKNNTTVSTTSVKQEASRPGAFKRITQTKLAEKRAHGYVLGVMASLHQGTCALARRCMSLLWTRKLTGDLTWSMPTLIWRRFHSMRSAG